MINYKKIIRAFLSYTPLFKYIVRTKGTSPVNGEYYKGIYENHIKKLNRFGFSKINGIIGEIDPGDTFGVGICALMDGFEKYYALDIIEHSDNTKNLKVMNELKKYYYSNLNRFDDIYDSIINNSRIFIDYLVPWENADFYMRDKFDLIISNAVMEHVLDLKVI